MGLWTAIWLAAVSSSLDPRLEEALGALAVEAISRADALEVSRVSRKQGKVVAGPELESLRAMVLDSRRYALPAVPLGMAAERLETEKLCAFRPEVALRFSGPGGRAELLLSLSCHQLAVERRDRRRDQRWERLDLTPSRNRWLRLVKRLFPKDEEVARHEESPVLAPVLARLQDAVELEAFRVMRPLDERRAYLRWRGLAPRRQAANLYEIWSDPVRLDAGLRKRALRLVTDRRLYSGPAKACEHPAGYALRLHLPARGHREGAIDLLFSLKCGTVEVARVATMFQDWRATSRILDARVGAPDEVLELLRDAMPDAGELETGPAGLSP